MRDHNTVRPLRTLVAPRQEILPASHPSKVGTSNNNPTPLIHPGTLQERPFGYILDLLGCALCRTAHSLLQAPLSGATPATWLFRDTKDKIGEAHFFHLTSFTPHRTTLEDTGQNFRLICSWDKCCWSHRLIA